MRSVSRVTSPEPAGFASSPHATRAAHMSARGRTRMSLRYLVTVASCQGGGQLGDERVAVRGGRRGDRLDPAERADGTAVGVARQRPAPTDEPPAPGAADRVLERQELAVLARPQTRERRARARLFR